VRVRRVTRWTAASWPVLIGRLPEPKTNSFLPGIPLHAVQKRH